MRSVLKLPAPARCARPALIGFCRGGWALSGVFARYRDWSENGLHCADSRAKQTLPLFIIFGAIGLPSFSAAELPRLPEARFGSPLGKERFCLDYHGIRVCAGAVYVVAAAVWRGQLHAKMRLGRPFQGRRTADGTGLGVVSTLP